MIFFSLLRLFFPFALGEPLSFSWIIFLDSMTQSQKNKSAINKYFYHAFSTININLFRETLKVNDKTGNKNFTQIMISKEQAQFLISIKLPLDFLFKGSYCRLKMLDFHYEQSAEYSVFNNEQTIYFEKVSMLFIQYPIKERKKSWSCIRIALQIYFPIQTSRGKKIRKAKAMYYKFD